MAKKQNLKKAGDKHLHNPKKEEIPVVKSSPPQVQSKPPAKKLTEEQRNEVDNKYKEMTNYALMPQEMRKTKCYEIIDSVFKEDPNLNAISPNRKILGADKLAAKLFAFIVDYDIDIIQTVFSMPGGVGSLARKGLFEIALIAGLRGWTPSKIVDAYDGKK